MPQPEVPPHRTLESLACRLSLKNEAPKPFELRWWALGLDGVDLADRNTADVMSRAGRTELRESPDEKGDDQDGRDKRLISAEL